MAMTPEGPVKKAVKWIAEIKRHEGRTDLMNLVREATAKFDLSPKDAEFLERFVTTEMKET
jgi:hypothetical protein